jgi:tetratricopeptide (TPR) repeat protein
MPSAPPRLWLKVASLVAAAGLLVIGLMRPETGEGIEEAPRRGRDLIFLLDVSRSMLAEDASPNRLEAAKAGIAELVKEFKAEGGLARGAVAVALLLVLGGFAGSTTPYDAVEEGNALYRSERYREAAQRYTGALEALPNSPLLEFNVGVAHLQLGDFATAGQAFARALDTDDTALAALAYYNLGNVRYRQALEAMPVLDEAQSFLGQAIAPYRASLAFDPGFADAMYNLELAYRLLDEIASQRGDSPNPEHAESETAPGKPGQAVGDSGNEPGGGSQPAQDQASRYRPGEASRRPPEGAPSRDDKAQGNPGAGDRYSMTTD